VFRQLQANEEAIDKYSSNIEELEEKKATASDTIQTLKVEIQVSREEVIRRTAELEGTIEGLNKQVEALLKERETLDPNSAAAREEKEQMLEKISKLVLRVEELNNKLDEAYRQVGRAEFDVKEALKDKADWMSKENAWIKRVQDVQAALERTESEKNTLLGREGQMVKQVMDLESALATMEASYKSKVDILTLERDSLAEIVEKQRQTLHIQKQQGESSLRMLAQRQAALDRVQSQLTDPESMEELNRLQQELSQMLTKEGEMLMNEIVDAKQLLEVVAALKDKFKDLEVLSQELQFERMQRLSLESDFSDLERKNDDLLRRIAGLEKEKEDFSALEQKYAASADVREELEHFKKLCTGWENRAQYWQNIAKKSMSIHSIPSTDAENARHAESSSSAADIADLKKKLSGKEDECKTLSVKLKEALDRAKKSEDETASTKESMQKELASLWLAVQELNTLDAAKDKALQDAMNERSAAVKERDELTRKLNNLQAEYAALQLELEVHSLK
jgi:chromosome segregation ATPase